MIEKGKIIGISNIIISSWILIYFASFMPWAIALVFGSIFISFNYYWASLHRSFWILGLISSIAFYYFAGRLFCSGLNLLKGKPNARRNNIIASLGILLGLLMTVSFNLFAYHLDKEKTGSFHFSRGIYLILIFVGLYTLILLLYFTRPKVKEQFK